MPARDGSLLPAYDLHVHTVYSGHSSPAATVTNMVAAAAENGVEVVAVSEHVPTVVPDIERWRAAKGDRSVIDAIAADLADIEPPEGAPRLLLGAEIDADPYSLDGSLMLEDLSRIGYVLASTHLFPGGEAFWFDADPGEGRERFGWSATLGVELLPDFLQLTGRWEELTAPDGAADAHVQQASGGLNLFYLEDRFVLNFTTVWRRQAEVPDRWQHVLRFQLRM